jgi:L,D-transpeptidase catalytic domain
MVNNHRLWLIAFLIFGISLLGFKFNPTEALAADINQENPAESFTGDVICLPGDYQAPGGTCSMLGPSAYLERMSRLGISFPLQPLDAISPNPSLTYVEIKYGEVVTPNAPVYASLEDAVKRGQVAHRIDSPYSFISYTDEAVVDGKRFYMVEYGGWMTANEISRIGSPSLFQGLQFDHTPDRPFAWILFPIQTKRAPGQQAEDLTGRELYRYQVVQIYASEMVDGIEWYMIGPDEWIPERQDYQRIVGRVLPNPNPPEGIEGNRWIEVNLLDQTIAAYDNKQLVFASLVASGIEPFWTRPGVFQIYDKLDSTPMRGSFEADRSDAYYLEDVPWTMYYDKARALHGAYWHNSFGSPLSHGCVNLSVGDARWLFDWAHDGDWVYVWDPSGKTPTDPALYGDGGA